MAGKLLKHIIHCLHTKLFFQPGRRIQCLDLAVHHNRYPVAIFRFIHIVCGNKYSDSTIGSLINQLPELPASSRINSSGRFIKEDYFGSWKIETEKASFCSNPKEGFSPTYPVRLQIPGVLTIHLSFLQSPSPSSHKFRQRDGYSPDFKIPHTKRISDSYIRYAF